MAILPCHCFAEFLRWLLWGKEASSSRGTLNERTQIIPYRRRFLTVKNYMVVELSSDGWNKNLSEYSENRRHSTHIHLRGSLQQSGKFRAQQRGQSRIRSYKKRNLDSKQTSVSSQSTTGLWNYRSDVINSSKSAVLRSPWMTLTGDISEVSWDLWIPFGGSSGNRLGLCSVAVMDIFMSFRANQRIYAMSGKCPTAKPSWVYTCCTCKLKSDDIQEDWE